MLHLPPLPIDEVLPEVTRALGEHRALVIQAPPGAGKTTRVPSALLELVPEGDVVVLEPRRVAARLAARRVAEERGEKVGETVGYEVRFERALGPRTRIKFLTEGILTQRLLSDPTLAGIGAVVLDEFHERHLHGDFALAWLRHLLASERPDLRVVVMSATLEMERVASFLGAPTVTSEGRAFPVAVEHLPRPDDRPLEQQVVSAVRDLARGGTSGDILVFLPGAAEIRRAIDRAAALAEELGFDRVALHGDLPAAEQDRALAPGPRRKVIFSTNVAETSVTIPGVVAVIDSGLARVARHDPWTGRIALEVAKVSRASAAQRAGRAGRLGPGRALRLYTQGDHDARPEHDAPEIVRTDLSELVLWLSSPGLGERSSLAWLDPPPPAALASAERLLARLGAIEASALTDTGRAMARLALPPRLARLVVEGERLGVADEACLAAAMLADGRDVYARGLWESPSSRGEDEANDLAPRLYDLRAVGGSGWDEARRFGLDPAVAGAVDRAYRQLVRNVRAHVRDAPSTPEEADVRLRRALLAAYPDRVAKRRAPEGGASRLGVSRELLLSSGGTALLAESSRVRTAPWLLALDAGDRSVAGRAGSVGKRTHVWLAAAIEPEWLIDLAPSALEETVEVSWEPQHESVFAVERLTYDKLVLDERPAGRSADAEIARVLAERALAAGIESFAGGDSFVRLRARIAFVAGAAPDLARASGIAPLDPAWLRDRLFARLEGVRSFAELRRAGLLDEVRAALGHAALARLDLLAPEQVTLGGGGGRRVRVEYEADKPPWIASRLSDFFGSRETPRVADGRVPLVLHLLAPNGRDVQVTTDLAGFWARTYPAVRSEMMRRYPRHPWPDDPLSARPPAPRAKRPGQQ